MDSNARRWSNIVRSADRRHGNDTAAQIASLSLATTTRDVRPTIEISRVAVTFDRNIDKISAYSFIIKNRT